MRISQVMTHKVITVKENATYEKVVEKLIKHKISGVAVVNKEGKICGIISEKDLLRPIFPSQEEFYKEPDFFMDQEMLEKEAIKLKKLKAADLMTADVLTVSPEDHVLEACALMIINHIRRLPVIQNDKLVGIVTTNNLFRRYLRKIVK